MVKVAVLGAGSWGTAISQVLADKGHQVALYGNNTSVAQEINEDRSNSRYLKDLNLPQLITATTDLAEAVDGAEYVFFVLPTAATRSVAQALNPLLDNQVDQPVIVHATKGLEQGTGLRISQVLGQVLRSVAEDDIVVLSGPSHAEEVAQRMLTTLTAASFNEENAELVQDLMMLPYFRVYTNHDVVGVELGGALKNIYAVMAGVSDALGYGDNTKAALMTRGLAEITRLGVKLGADPMTFGGLSGIGDLIVTCTSDHSRNYQAGQLIGQGQSLSQANDQIDMVVEGVLTVKVAHELSQDLGEEMPLASGLYYLLYEGGDLEKSISGLMMREGKKEASLRDHIEKLI